MDRLASSPVRLGRAQRDQVLGLDQVLRVADLAAQADDDVGRHVGMVGEAGQDALEDLVVGPLERQPAAPLVRDGEDAVDVGELGLPGGRRGTARRCTCDVLAEQLTVLITAM